MPTTDPREVWWVGLGHQGVASRIILMCKRKMEKTLYLTSRQYRDLGGWLFKNNLHERVSLTNVGEQCFLIKRKVENPTFRKRGIEYVWHKEDETSCGICAMNNLMQTEIGKACEDALTTNKIKNMLTGHFVKQHYVVEEIHSLDELKDNLDKQSDGIVGVLMQEKIFHKEPKEPRASERHWIAFRKGLDSWITISSSYADPKILSVPLIEYIQYTWTDPILIVSKQSVRSDSTTLQQEEIYTKFGKGLYEPTSSKKMKALNGAGDRNRCIIHKVEGDKKFQDMGINYVWTQKDYISCGVCAVNNLMQTEILRTCDKALTADELKNVLEAYFSDHSLNYVVETIPNIHELNRKLEEENDNIFGLLLQEYKTTSKSLNHWLALKKEKASWVVVDSLRDPQTLNTLTEFIGGIRWTMPILMVSRKLGSRDSRCPNIEKVEYEDVDRHGIRYFWMIKDQKLDDTSTSGWCAIYNLLQAEVAGDCQDPLDTSKIKKILDSFIITGKRIKVEVIEKLENVHINTERSASLLGFILRLKENDRSKWVTLKKVKKKIVGLDSMKDKAGRPQEWNVVARVLEKKAPAIELPILKVSSHDSKSLSVASSSESDSSESDEEKETTLEQDVGVDASYEEGGRGDNRPPVAALRQQTSKEQRAQMLSEPKKETPRERDVNFDSRLEEQQKGNGEGQPLVQPRPQKQGPQEPQSRERALPKPTPIAIGLLRTMIRPEKCKEADEKRSCMLKVFGTPEALNEHTKVLRVMQYFYQEQLSPELVEAGYAKIDDRDHLVVLMEKFPLDLEKRIVECMTIINDVENKETQDIYSKEVALIKVKNAFGPMVGMLDNLFTLVLKIAIRGWFYGDIKPPNLVVKDQKVRVIDIELNYMSFIEDDMSHIRVRHKNKMEKISRTSLILLYSATMLLILYYYMKHYTFQRWGTNEIVKDEILRRIRAELKSYAFHLPSYEDVQHSHFWKIWCKLISGYYRNSPQASCRQFWKELGDNINHIEVSETPSHKGKNITRFNTYNFNEFKDLPKKLSEFTIRMAKQLVSEGRPNPQSFATP